MVTGRMLKNFCKKITKKETIESLVETSFEPLVRELRMKNLIEIYKSDLIRDYDQKLILMKEITCYMVESEQQRTKVAKDTIEDIGDILTSTLMEDVEDLDKPLF